MIERLLLRASPWGLLAAGLAVGITASPLVRKGLRAVAVETTRAALSVSDAVKNCGEKVSEGLSGIVAEAKSQPGGQLDNVKNKARTVGVAAVGSGLAVVDKVKETAGEFKHKWDDLVAEAREQKEKGPEITAEKAEENPVQ